MRIRINRTVFIGLLFGALVPVCLTQTMSNSTPEKIDHPSQSRSEIEAAIRKTIEDENAGYARRDGAAVLAHMSDEEGMYYDRDSGRMGTQALKGSLLAGFDTSKSDKSKLDFEITELYVLPLASDITLANYVLLIKVTSDGKTEVTRQADTDIFVLRDGRWLRRSQHGEVLPKEVAPVVAGMPIDWERSPGGVGDSYSMTVDATTKHSGRASASMRFICSSDAQPWGSLSQAIDAAQFKGKRVRLTGWIKTADVEYAGLWLRADAERQIAAFDNMMDRPVKGTTDWKRYEVVLDIPDSTINLHFGALLEGKGQAWFDDFAIEVVGSNIPVTLKAIESGKDGDEYSEPAKRSSRAVPINLGFENGVVK